ncbi:pro-resilin-like isoform X2 [Cydia pomonella]|uniref:pro-resilin-like isoform X2 n=1 Tax=Cydia pomonella TaxID=82600 RepID=UPI002ADE6C7C|nr:pro-resilin-like isoform X2 [Cydia pomonella]
MATVHTLSRNFRHCNKNYFSVTNNMFCKGRALYKSLEDGDISTFVVTSVFWDTSANMKTIIATAVLVAITLAEPPPSNSYLPPAAGRSGGYPSGGPQGSGVIAARSGLDHGLDHHDHGHAAQGNGFARSGLNGLSGGHGSHGHGQQARFGQEQQGYDHNAAAFGRNALEESATVSYEADERGFKPHISYEDTDASARSGGYDSNANNARSGHDSFGNGGHGNHGNARSNGY